MRKFGSLIVIVGLCLAGTAHAKPVPKSKESNLPAPTTEANPEIASTKDQKKDPTHATKYKLGFLQALLSEPLAFTLEACEKMKGKIKIAETTEDNEAWMDCDSRFAVLVNKDEEVTTAVLVASNGASLPELRKVLGPPSKVEAFKGNKITSWKSGDILLTHIDDGKEPVLFMTKIPTEGDDFQYPQLKAKPQIL